MKYEDLFEYVGHFGKYQLLLYILLGLPSIYPGYQNVAMNFLGAKMRHWCKVPELQGLSHELQRYIAIPKDKEGKYVSCQVYVRNYSQYSRDDFLNWNRSVAGNASTARCSEWVYDQSVFHSTVVSQYNLVCDRAFLVQLVSTIYLFGMFIGAFASGVVSDKIGRWKTCFIGLVGQIIFAFAAAFAPNYPVFVVLRWAVCVFNTFSFLCSFVIIIEVIGPKYRVHTGVFYQIFFSIGFMLLPGVAYLIRDHKKLQIALAFPPVASIIAMWVIPESARWLLVKDRKKECLDIFRKIARFNKQPFPENVDLHYGEEDEVAKGTVVDLFKSRVMRNRTLIIYYLWFTVTLIYYGLSLNAGTLSGSVFLNTFLMGAVEVPANIICIVTLALIGRRYPIGVAYIFGAVTSFVGIALLNREHLAWLLTTLSMLGKAASTVCFSGIYVFTAELMPTEVRHVGVGSSSTVARIGGMASPYMGGPLRNVWPPMPSVIFGVLSALAGIATFFLPETLGKTIPDTVAEAEHFGRKTQRETKKEKSTD